LGWDEITLYGNIAKYVANGWVSSDYIYYEFFHSADKLAQVAAEQEIYAVNDNNFSTRSPGGEPLFLSIGFYSLIRWLGAIRLWSLVSIAGFPSVPDLVWWGTSLKVNSVTMGLGDLRSVIAYDFHGIAAF